jgi:hypothetical protein
MATENPSELFSRQLRRTCGTNLIIEIINLIAETKYNQSKKVKFPIFAKAPPPIAATHARAMRNLNTKEGVVGCEVIARSGSSLSGSNGSSSPEDWLIENIGV